MRTLLFSRESLVGWICKDGLCWAWSNCHFFLQKGKEEFGILVGDEERCGKKEKKVWAIWQEARRCALEISQKSFNYKISSAQFKEFLYFCEMIYFYYLSSITVIVYVISIFCLISPNPSSIPQNALHTHKFLMGVIYIIEIRGKAGFYMLEKQQGGR